MRPHLDAATLEAVDAHLAGTDQRLATDYPGDDGSRQPVHTVYVPADRYRAGLAHEWGEQARRLLADNGGTEALLEAVGVRPDLRAEVAATVEDKLAREPVEDLRIDFEDGYGDRGDEAEDRAVLDAATAVREEVDAAAAPAFVGIRFKSFEAATRSRGLRTLDLFLGALTDSGELPAGLVLTLPKVTTSEQVEAMVLVCRRLEEATGLPAGRLRFEVQVETPQSILDVSGRATVARMVHAGQGRVSALHYGTYDYSASLGIAASHQTLEHPAADHAKAVMQLAVAGTGVRLSDGSTNVLPVGDPAQVRAAWANHGRLVTRSLERGYYQGWDMHPGHLPSRFAATYAFYREGFGPAAERLRAYVDQRAGAVMDEPATATALAWFLLRGLDCGALAADELGDRAGLSPADLSRLSGRGRPEA